MARRRMHRIAYTYTVTSGFNILTDIWILLLPIPTLRSLKISRHSRYVLYGIFGVGAFATAMSIVRLYSIHIYTLAEDPFKDGVLVRYPIPTTRPTAS